MSVFKDLFSSATGLMSLAVLAGIAGMAGFFIAYVVRHVRQDSKHEHDSR